MNYGRWTACAVSVLLSLGILAACGGDSDSKDTTVGGPAPVVETPAEKTPISMALSLIGEYVDGREAAAEITAYDASSKRLFVVNGVIGTVDVLDLSDPTAPKKIDTISASAYGGGINSVAVHNGLVALAVQATTKTDPGKLALYRASDLALLSTTTVGALPDMVTFTPDGKTVLLANEGEPNDYITVGSVDPEGSISIVDVSNPAAPVARTAGFASYNSSIASLRAAGVRIYGPGATVAQDLEPEYITVSDDGKTAYVTLQENNALAIVDVAGATVTDIKPLGYKDYNLAGYGLDASDRDSVLNANGGTSLVKIAPQPVKGMYLPDAIAHYTVGGTGYLITANEGDTRVYTGFSEETRVRTHCSASGLEPSVFSDAANLIFDSNLGRLRITTTPNGGSDGKNGSGRCTDLFAFGGRSFSIWTTSGVRVFDSGDQFEQRTSAIAGLGFNASNDDNDVDSRSPTKGPEPEGVTVARFGTKTFAFIGLERVGGVMVYDVSNPSAPSYVTYVNSRTGATGHRGPEGLTVIPAERSPNGVPLLVVGNETSGSTAVYKIDLQY